jgi:hypothetical protein
MSASSQANPLEENELEAAVDEAIAACGGDLRAAIRALIVANNFLESEVSELMKAVSHAYTRGVFRPIPADAAGRRSPQGCQRRNLL